MTRRRAGTTLLVVQLLLVLSIAAKYLYERHTRPRVWVRAVPFESIQPLRGRYLALQLELDACTLPRDREHFTPGFRPAGEGAPSGSWRWNVSLQVEDGHLVPHLEPAPFHPPDTHQVELRAGSPCSQAWLHADEEFFLPDRIRDGILDGIPGRAKSAFSLPAGTALWVEVTVPRQGPPRPVQLALSDATGFHPLQPR